MTVVRLHGLEQTLRNFREIEPRLQKNALRAAVNQLATETRDDARARVPQDTGNLRRNITSKRGRGFNKHQVSGLVVVREERGDRVMSRAEWRSERFKRVREAIKNAFYWRFIEYGTRFLPARPFLRPALDRLRASIDRRFADAVRGKFERALAGLKKAA